jgi:PilZ domain
MNAAAWLLPFRALECRSRLQKDSRWRGRAAHGFVSSSFTTDPKFLAFRSSISQIQTSYCAAMDKRAVQRSPVLKAGTIEFPGGAFSCMVRNLSEQGAALDVPSLAGIPHDFILVIPLEGRRFYCRSVWRKERRIGVSFE